MLEILVVDDEKDICRSLEKALEDQGFRLTLVTRGEAAIREVKGRSFDAAGIAEGEVSGFHQQALRTR